MCDLLPIPGTIDRNSEGICENTELNLHFKFRFIRLSCGPFGRNAVKLPCERLVASATEVATASKPAVLPTIPRRDAASAAKVTALCSEEPGFGPTRKSDEPKFKPANFNWEQR